MSGARCATVLSVTRQAVSAAGVPAEWVESTPASLDQGTLVYLHDNPCGAGSTVARVITAKLAGVTGARVLRIGCGGHHGRSPVAEAVDAYKWLCGEGVDLLRTAFVGDSSGARDLITAAVMAAKAGNVPSPAVLVELQVEPPTGAGVDEAIAVLADLLRHLWAPWT